MKPAKLKVVLKDPVYAVLTVDLKVPAQQRMLAESMGITDEQLENLLGQTLQFILATMGNSDEV